MADSFFGTNQTLLSCNITTVAAQGCTATMPHDATKWCFPLDLLCSMKVNTSYFLIVTVSGGKILKHTCQLPNTLNDEKFLPCSWCKLRYTMVHI